MPDPLEYESPKDRAERAKETGQNEHELYLALPPGRRGMRALWVPLWALCLVLVGGVVPAVVFTASLLMATLGITLSLIGIGEKECKVEWAWVALILNGIGAICGFAIYWILTHLKLG